LSRFALSPSCVIVGLVVAAAAVAANPTWATAVGLDVWNLPRLEQVIADEAAKAREVDHEDDEVLRRMERKDRLVDELISERVTLADVTAEFLAMNQNRDGHMTVIRATWPGRNDEERTARNILHFVSLRLSELPAAERDEVSSRLESELAQFLAHSAAAE